MTRSIPRLTAIALLAAGLAGCSPAPPTPAPTVSSSAEPNPADVACELERQPGPDDAGPDPNGGDLIDVADIGGGRARICVAGPQAISVEGTAWCRWSDDRTIVTEVSLLPDFGGGPSLDGGAAFDRNEAYLAFTPRPGQEISSYTGVVREEPQGARDRTAGTLTFRVAPTIDPEHPPAVRPADQVGTMAWACGDPPGPRAGRSTGIVELRLDAPVDRTWRVAAACDWVTGPAGQALRAINTWPPDIDVNERFVGLGFSRSVDGTWTDVSIWVDEHDGGDFYSGPSESQHVIRVAPDGGAGLVRFRHLAPSEGSTVRFAEGIEELSGTLDWVCPRPVVAGPDAPAEPPPEPAETHPGSATITFRPAVVAPAEVEVTCTIDRSDPAHLRVDEVTGTFTADGREVRLRLAGSRVLLVLVGEDGRPDGEYLGDTVRIGDQADRPGLLADVDHLVFEPTDPDYTPLGGPDGQRDLALTMTYACVLAVPS